MLNKTVKKNKKKANLLSNDSKRQSNCAKRKNEKLSCITRSKSLIGLRDRDTNHDCHDLLKLNKNNKPIKFSLRLKKIEPINYMNETTTGLQLNSRTNNSNNSKAIVKMKKPNKCLVEKQNSTKNQLKTIENKSKCLPINRKQWKQTDIRLKSKKLFKTNKIKQFVDSKKNTKNHKYLKKPNKLNSLSKEKNIKIKKTDSIKKMGNSSQFRSKTNTSKKEVKCTTKHAKDIKVKIGKNELLKRGHRVASLNAIAKVRLLCENEREKGNDLIEIDAKPNVKDDRKFATKSIDKNNRKSELVSDDDSKKQLVRKRKLSDKIEIIDTRSCKRMASLNASAIMAASYSPQRIKHKPIESTYSDSSSDLIKSMKISSTVSHIEISPTINVINGIHFAEAKSVILKSKNPEQIEFIDNLKVSNKIRERLLGIARLEDYENRKKRRKQSSKSNGNISREDNSISSTSSEVSGFQSTKVQVTKVTQINTSQETKCDKEKKSGHKIESILERDSSVVHKYQVQTKSTIQMATSFNPSTASNLANVCSLPQLSQTGGAVPRFQLHISATPAQVIPTPILSTSTGHSTLNFSSPTSVQFYNNNNQYQTMPSSGSHLNPMSIVNFCETYPSHYTSAFSVPHFADHTHSQPLFNYFYPGIYQPAGPLLQPLHDSCLIHKPIPFHPQTSQSNHVHSTQFSSTPIQTQTGQTFQNDLQTQPLLSTTQILQQLPPNSIRQPQTLFFQTLPQTNTSISPSTTFAILNPNVQYTQPSIVTEKYNEVHPVCNESSNCLSAIVNNDNASSFEQTSHSNSIEYLCKGIQCSPTRKDSYQNQNSSHISSFDSTKSIGTKDMKTIVSERSNNIKRFKSNDSQNSLKRKKSMLLKPQANQKAGQTVIDESLVSNIEPESVSGNSGTNIVKSASTSNNSNPNNSDPITQTKITKTLCVPVISMASVSLPRFLPSKKQGKKRYSHGWSWEGEPTDKFIYVNNEDQPFLRKSYPAIRHNEGDIIKTRDCVLLRSGPKKTDLPFVAKIAALWETSDGEMMMSLLWYYRPEHTDLEYYSTQIRGEIFASKHRDTNSVACIDDKCYVLTYNEFCRYQRLKLLKKFPVSFASTIVPPLDEPYPRTDRLPPIRIFPELVFCCRKVYDYRQKRILKNPI